MKLIMINKILNTFFENQLKNVNFKVDNLLNKIKTEREKPETKKEIEEYKNIFSQDEKNLVRDSIFYVHVNKMNKYKNIYYKKKKNNNYN